MGAVFSKVIEVPPFRAEGGAAFDVQGRPDQGALFRVKEVEVVGGKVHGQVGADADQVLAGPAGGEQGVAHFKEHLGLVAHHLCVDHFHPADALRSGGGRFNLLGANADLPLVALGQVGNFLPAEGHGDRVAQHQGGTHPLGLHQVHLGRADEAGHKGVGGFVVQLQRRAGLLDFPTVQHHDPIAHGHCFHLVVGHVDHGQAQLFLQPADFRAHLAPEFGVQVGKGLVHQADRGLAADAAGQGHTLALAAGELSRLAL